MHNIKPDKKYHVIPMLVAIPVTDKGEAEAFDTINELLYNQILDIFDGSGIVDWAIGDSWSTVRSREDEEYIKEGDLFLSTHISRPLPVDIPAYVTEDGHMKVDCPECTGAEHVADIHEHERCLTCRTEKGEYYLALYDPLIRETTLEPLTYHQYLRLLGRNPHVIHKEEMALDKQKRKKCPKCESSPCPDIYGYKCIEGHWISGPDQAIEESCVTTILHRRQREGEKYLENFPETIRHEIRTHQ